MAACANASALDPELELELAPEHESKPCSASLSSFCLLSPSAFDPFMYLYLARTKCHEIRTLTFTFDADLRRAASLLCLEGCVVLTESVMSSKTFTKHWHCTRDGSKIQVKRKPGIRLLGDVVGVGPRFAVRSQRPGCEGGCGARFESVRGIVQSVQHALRQSIHGVYIVVAVGSPRLPARDSSDWCALAEDTVAEG